MIQSNIPMQRIKYFIMSENKDWFVKKDKKNDFSFTSEIEIALSYYNKETAFDVSDKCNKIGMKTIVVCIEITYYMWT